MSPLSKRGRVRALQNLGAVGRPPRRTLSRWRFTESSQRELSEIDGKPEGVSDLA